MTELTLKEARRHCTAQISHGEEFAMCGGDHLRLVLAALKDAEETLERLAAATPNSTNSATPAEMSSWTQAVSATALARIRGNEAAVYDG